jgi:anti-sigma factor RsiW
MNERHLSDDRLIDICVSGAPDADEGGHLSACTTCTARHASIVEILRELDEAATVQADAAFPDDKLVRQQARIFQRIEQDGRPGRVLSFPAGYGQVPLLASRPPGRVAAAAAAAAFVVGLLAGHLAHEWPLEEERQPSQVVAIETDSAPLRAVSTTFSEDEFLGQIEVAAASNGPAALRTLDAMTPRAWDVR